MSVEHPFPWREDHNPYPRTADSEGRNVWRADIIRIANALNEENARLRSIINIISASHSAQPGVDCTCPACIAARSWSQPNPSGPPKVEAPHED